MKVFFTIDALINAGTEKSVLDIVSNFSQDTRVKVIYFYPRHDLKPLYEKAGIPVHFADLKGRTSFRKGIRQLTRLIREEKPDIIVSSILRANLMSRIACRITGTRLIGTFISDSYSAERQSSFSSKRKIGAWFYYHLDKLTAFIPQAWISNSHSIAESNCRHLGVDPAKVKVIHRGRDFRKFPERKRALPGNTFNFCFVGRLLQTKGVGELIEAFSALMIKYQNARLHIYGEGPYRKALVNKVSDLGLNDKIIIHGAVANGWEKLYDADCFVFPSWYEGFSGSLVEAMMAGIPIIASDIPMNLEAVHDQSTALIHKVKNVQDLAAKMESMIMHYPKMVKMGFDARLIAAQRFDIRVIACQYESFIREQANAGTTQINANEKQLA